MSITCKDFELGHHHIASSHLGNSLAVQNIAGPIIIGQKKLIRIMLMTMYNLCTIALLYDVRTPTEPFKRKIVRKKLTPACDVAFSAA